MNSPHNALAILRPTRPSARIAGLVGLAAAALIGSAASADHESVPNTGTPATPASARRMRDCRSCHSCDRPTPERSCLPVCARHAQPQTPERGPDVVIMNELEAVYQPVPFDHQGHAKMAEMTRGCATCHHHSPADRPPPACKSCHEVSTAGTDIHKPGLKGAYHQQCLNCHRQWMNERDCDACHLPKEDLPPERQTPPPTKDDLLGRMHPPVPPPQTEIYEGRTDEQTWTKVVFRHQEHVSRFGLQCVECHHESSCTRCHTRTARASSPRTPAEHHQPCVQCHHRDMDMTGRRRGSCSRCHWQEGQPQPAPFDHADTGWPLKEYHRSVACRECHRSTPFVRLANACDNCHQPWDPNTFDHRVTGQLLDENHAEHDCEECHLERLCNGRPRCDECHDPEIDGITFPDQRPGPVVSLKAAPPAPGDRL